MCFLHQKKLVLFFLFMFIVLGSYWMPLRMLIKLWPKDHMVIFGSHRYGRVLLHSLVNGILVHFMLQCLLLCTTCLTVLVGWLHVVLVSLLFLKLLALPRFRPFKMVLKLHSECFHICVWNRYLFTRVLHVTHLIPTRACSPQRWPCFLAFHRVQLKISHRQVILIMRPIY